MTLRKLKLTSGIVAAASVRRFLSHRKGNFAVTFALTAPILIVLVGMGVDYLTGLSFKARWDAAADAAALSAVQTAQAYVNANAASQTPATLKANAIAAGQAAGVKAFNANAGTAQGVSPATPTIVITSNGRKYTATATYTGTTPSAFGAIVGITKLSEQGLAVASSSGTTYINYYFIVDTSNSMGIGSTATDMQNLYNRTKAYGYSSDGEDGCVFACHVPGASSHGGTTQYSNEYLAHNISPTITLRIDAAKSAIQNVITDGQNDANGQGNIKFAIYTMQQDPSTGVELNTIASLSSNYASLSTAAGTIDLGNNTAQGFGDSNFATGISDFANTLATAPSGDGSSSATPLNYVFIITDGVQDVPYSFGATCTSVGMIDNHCVAAFNPALCTSLKLKATVGVIYTTYLPIYHDNNSANGLTQTYSDLVAPIAANIAPNLQSCSSGAAYYYQASDGPTLNSAMTALFASTVSPLSLQQ